jgi:hypothetical protein
MTNSVEALQLARHASRTAEQIKASLSAISPNGTFNNKRHGNRIDFSCSYTDTSGKPSLKFSDADVSRLFD